MPRPASPKPALPQAEPPRAITARAAAPTRAAPEAVSTKLALARVAEPKPSPQARPMPAVGWRWLRPKHWYLVFATVGVLAVLATCGVFSYRLVQDEIAGRNAQANNFEPPPATIARDISTREADPEPLTKDEVFPTEEIVVNPSEPPYRVLTVEASENCGSAAADELARLLDELDCSQVVRATLRSPNENYLITGGVLNLKTETGAEDAYERIQGLVEDGSGRFLGLLAGDGTEPIVLSETVLFWDYRGHYLMYAVIARADGEELSDADNRYADLISWDIIEVHLRGGVLEARANQPNPALQTVTPPASPAAGE